MSYQIEPLDREEYATLCWLSERGYDAGILDSVSVELTDDDGAILGPIPEHVAWEINERYNEDPHAFLTCNGSESLAEKLYKFINSIV